MTGGGGTHFEFKEGSFGDDRQVVKVNTDDCREALGLGHLLEFLHYALRKMLH